VAGLNCDCQTPKIFAPPSANGKNMIFWRKIVIFHKKYPKSMHGAGKAYHFDAFNLFPIDFIGGRIHRLGVRWNVLGVHHCFRVNFFVLFTLLILLYFTL
jgi:hypothetical protein